jgi:hypothetical protein
MRSFLTILTISIIAATALAQVVPSWWYTRNVLAPNSVADDYAAVNQGQLKHLARQTVAEFNARLPGGAGDDLNALVDSWLSPSASVDDFQVVTVGQLKALGVPFYKRLDQVRLMMVPDWAPIMVPWSGQSLISPTNEDVVNIGQVKELFSALEGNRRDYVGGGWDSLSTAGRMGLSWLVDSDEDGFTDLDEIVHNSDPEDASTQPAVRLEVVSGNGQWIGAGETLAAPVVLAVKRGYANLPAMQVSVSLPTGTGVGTLANAASGPWQSSLTLTSNASGQVEVWWRAPAVLAQRPYPFFASLMAPYGSGPVPLYANVRPADPNSPLQLSWVSQPLLSQPIANRTTVPVSVLVTRAGLVQSGFLTRLRIQGAGGRLAASPNGPWQSQLDLPTNQDGRIQFHWRSQRHDPGVGSLRVSLPGHATQPVELTVPTHSQAPYVLTVISTPVLLRGADSSNALPVIALVTQNGDPVKATEVHLLVSQTGGQISSTAAGPWGKSVTLRTNAYGEAQAWWLGESQVAGGNVTLQLPDQPAVSPVVLPSVTTPPGTNDDPNTDGLSPTQRLLGRLPFEIEVRRKQVYINEGGARGPNDETLYWEPNEQPPIKTTRLIYGPEGFPMKETSIQVDEDTAFAPQFAEVYWVRPEELSYGLESSKSYSTREEIDPTGQTTDLYTIWNKDWKGVTFEFRIKPKGQVPPGTKLVLPYVIETLQPDVPDYLPQMVTGSEFGVLQIIAGSDGAEPSQKKSVTCVVPYTGDNSERKKKRVRLLPFEIDIRQPQSSTYPPILASLGSTSVAGAMPAGGTGVINTPSQDDDFAVVSNGTDPDLASELVINMPSGAGSGTITANVKMKGSDGSLKFEQNSVTITPGTPTVMKIWGTTASSGENKSKVEVEFVMSGGAKASIEEDLTIIDGVKISFEGTFYSPVDSRIENWRPSLTAQNSRGVDDDAAVIAADIGDFTSNISFTDGDQPVSYRAWSPKPKVTVSKVEAINPPMELKKDPLKGAEVHMTSGAFQHFASATEKIEHPNLVFKTGGAAAQTFFSANVVGVVDLPDGSRSVDTPINTNMGAHPGGVALMAKVSAAANGGDMLAKWLLCQTPITPLTNRLGLNPTSFMDFLEKGLGGASADWSNQKFNVLKGADLSNSIGAKAVLGAQDKRGANKTKVEWKLHHYDCWDLSGKVTDAKLETP